MLESVVVIKLVLIKKIIISNVYKRKKGIAATKINKIHEKKIVIAKFFLLNFVFIK